MKFTLRVSEKRPLKVFKVDRTFKTRSKVTERTLQVAEAFGIGVDAEREFPVFIDFQVEVNPGDIVYITGDSGGGKSTLLRELGSAMQGSGEFGEVAYASEISFNEDEIVVEALGRDVDEAIRCLSLAGLNEAFLFLRRCGELSDGQKYRFKAAKMLYMNKAVWVFDEFCATLDRETAKIVAFCLQKTARRSRKTLMVATTHRDLYEDLAPNVHVLKGFGSEVFCEYHKNAKQTECSLMKRIQIRQGTIEDYRQLEYYHYRAGRPFGPKRIFAAEYGGRIVGAIIFSLSPSACSGRRRFFGRSVPLEEVNRDFLIISRVVVHPKFRSIGLGARLVRETLPLAGAKYVEAIAVMARYNPFFAKAGMTEVDYKSSWAEQCRRGLESLRKFGINPAYASSTGHIVRRLEALSENQYKRLLEELLSSPTSVYLYCGHVYGHKTPPRSRLEADTRDRAVTAKIIHGMAIRAQQKKYYIWTSRKVQSKNHRL